MLFAYFKDIFVVFFIVYRKRFFIKISYLLYRTESVFMVFNIIDMNKSKVCDKILDIVWVIFTDELFFNLNLKKLKDSEPVHFFYWFDWGCIQSYHLSWVDRSVFQWNIETIIGSCCARSNVSQIRKNHRTVRYPNENVWRGQSK